MQSLKDILAAMPDEEYGLREMLWLRHGCGMGSLYGDDGERQCNKCLIDFIRDSAKSIKQRLYDISVREFEYSKQCEHNFVYSAGYTCSKCGMFKLKV